MVKATNRKWRQLTWQRGVGEETEKALPYVHRYKDDPVRLRQLAARSQRGIVAWIRVNLCSSKRIRIKVQIDLIRQTV